MVNLWICVCVCLSKKIANKKKRKTMVQNNVNFEIPKLNAVGKVLSFGRWVVRSEKVIMRWLLRKICVYSIERERDSEEEEKEEGENSSEKWGDGDVKLKHGILSLSRLVVFFLEHYKFFVFCFVFFVKISS